jgi:CDP-diacylglycerol---serine O-phosphatidyltransferase
VNFRKHIPNSITLGNLFCGCLAIVKAFDGDLMWTAYLVGIALILDFFDGFVARLLNVSSAIGKDLDSLADMVTFGLVPGIVMFHLLIDAAWIFMNGNNVSISDGAKLESSGFMVLPYFAFVITIFSCIRLAKFNNDTRQSTSFIGLPTPANTMLICSLPLIRHFHSSDGIIISWIENPWFLCSLSLTLSLLLIAEIPLFALKFKTFSLADNKLVYMFLTLALILILSIKFLAIPLIIILYVLISIVNNVLFKTKIKD